MLWILSTLSGILLLILMVLVIWLLKNHTKSQSYQNQFLKLVIDQNQELMTRMMSKDLPAYQTMKMTEQMTTTQTLTSDPYYSQSDAAEVARLQGLAAGGGLGQAIYDEDSELEEVIGEMGLR